MKDVIIGTAGHVDHGKTCLIKALTGIDTDRLKEEKERGITIELGFAYLDMPDGSRAGIVDVPGHEKFVKNMLAGAAGIDLAMLVVAADEGIMPQTVEHLDILSILGIKNGVIIITKTDKADTELVKLVEEDIRELTEGTFLENAPVVSVSVYRNEGIEELKEILYQMCKELPERAWGNQFRLPIDRVFTLNGFGTIITGTVAEGKIKKEQEAVLYPANISVKIRSIQVHESDTDIACAGQRAAVNIPDRKKEEILRGDVLAQKDSMYPTHMIDVRVEVLKHTERTIKYGSRVHVYHGTKELLGKIILMDRDELKAGESCYAQLRLEGETAVRKGDRFVLRFYSPAETVGGGVVLDACPGKHRRNDKEALRAFAIKENGTQEEMLEISLREHWGCYYDLQELCKRSSLDRSKVKIAAKKLEEEKKIVCLFDEVYIHREELASYRKKTEGFLDEFHKVYPLKEGMGAEEVRSRLALGETRLNDAVLDILKKEKIIKEQHGRISRQCFRVVVKEDENAIMGEITRYYLEAGYAPLTTELYWKEHCSQKKFQAVFLSLLNNRTLIRLNAQYCIHREWYEKAMEAFREMAKEKPVVVTGEYRDYLGCSRKTAIALLEHFDKNGFTRKTEEGRVLKARK